MATVTATTPPVVLSASNDGIKNKTNEQCVETLNNLVLRKTNNYYSKRANSEDATQAALPEFEAVRDHHKTIYRSRFSFLVFGYLAAATYLVFQAPSIPVALLCFAVMFVWYDLYSGILHVVLDEPSNISLPLIGQACLEFQWHHHIPQDIVSKSYLQVCGDLNLVVAMSFAWYVGFMQFTTGPAAALVGFKVFMAMFGQFSHRMSHAILKQRPAWVQFLQRNGVLLSPEAHGVHHQTYDDNFCIGSGFCSPIIKALLSVNRNRFVWLFALLFVSFVDVLVFDALFKLAL